MSALVDRDGPETDPISPRGLPSNDSRGAARAACPKDGEILIQKYELDRNSETGQVPVDYAELVSSIALFEQQLERLGLGYTAPANLSIITAWGQSMRGTISDKDLALIDRGINEYVGDGIYLITWAGHLFLKRLQLAGADQLELISDSPAHKTRTVAMDDVKIHARAVLVWKASRP
ncbi:helix-turn-helix transcriptional regulator [Pseudomonas sp. GCM10022186]|uniref:S24 family peptidase n=1 Tax=Pseudomonas sp. GCM10022186 TaxID=3252650 RepID=UPI00361F34C1